MIRSIVPVEYISNETTNDAADMNSFYLGSAEIKVHVYGMNHASDSYGRLETLLAAEEYSLPHHLFDKKWEE